MSQSAGSEPAAAAAPARPLSILHVLRAPVGGLFRHVVDLARAHVLAVEHLLNGGGNLVLNLGTGRGTSIREIVDAIDRLTGRRVPVEMRPRRAGDPPELVADPSRARAVLEWTPRYADLSTIVSHAWKWHSGRGK